MTNLKTVVTLAAVASLAVALAPTGASASFNRFAGGGNHTANVSHPTNGGGSFGGNHPVNGGGNGGGSHPVNGGSFHPQSHAGWHPSVSHDQGNRAGWHRQYGWHDSRPVEIDVVEGYRRPHYDVPHIATYVPAPAPTYPAKPQAVVNGQNVAVVGIPNAEYVMVEQGKWVKQGANGEHYEFTEDNRDESSVYLTDASRGVSLQLDLSQKQVYLLGPQQKRPVFPIVNVSATVRRG
jgi:hypothetical protein